jgi:CheY-like chemotaxis protein
MPKYARSMPTPSDLDIDSRHNVLVVDDYEDAVVAIVTLFQANGVDAVGAALGPEALDMLQAGLQPCVILLDVRMPGMDGWEVWDRLKAHNELSKTAVVILSAEGADPARARAASGSFCASRWTTGSWLKRLIATASGIDGTRTRSAVLSLPA